MARGCRSHTSAKIAYKMCKERQTRVIDRMYETSREICVRVEKYVKLKANSYACVPVSQHVLASSQKPFFCSVFLFPFPLSAPLFALIASVRIHHLPSTSLCSPLSISSSLSLCFSPLSYPALCVIRRPCALIYIRHLKQQTRNKSVIYRYQG